MKASEFFWRRDARRNRVRVTAIGWISLVLVVIVLLAAGWAALRPRPVVVAEEEPTPTSAPPTPTPTPIVHEACPSDPAMWRTEPYTLPNGKVLYKLDPPCAMGLVEEAYGELMEYMEARSDRWTKEDEARVRWYGPLVSPLTGKAYPPRDLDMTWEAYPDTHCREPVSPTEDHRPRFVFYTADPEDPGLVVVYVIQPPYEIRLYNCETGETGEVISSEAYQGYYVTLVFDEEAGAWKIGLAEEIVSLPADADVDGSISLIRQLQGR